MSWTLTGLLRAAGLLVDTTGDADVAGLTADSRVVSAGDLFCCWRGAAADGHAFAADAVEAGAVALLVEYPVDVDVPTATLPAVHPVLGPLAATFFGHPSRDLAVAAVT